MIYDVAIIGGGLAGCSAALFLRQRGVSVVLFERRLCGSQASGVNYGGLRHQGRHFAEFPLAKRSREIWPRLEELIGSNCEYTRSGHLKLALSDTDMSELEAHAEQVRAFGLELELIGRSDIRNRFPYLGKAVVGGSYSSEDGHVNPRLVVPAFARTARAAGADIREGVEVSRVAHDGREFHLQTSTGPRVNAHRLINVAGAWGSTISAQFGERVPEDVMSPNMCVTDPIPFFLPHNLGVCGGSIYIRQIRRGNVIFGGGVGIGDRARIKARAIAGVTAAAIRDALDCIPLLSNAHIIRSWSGIEGVMPDGLPVVGLSQTTPGLVHAFGFSGHGFLLGPAVGAVVTELALDQSTSTSIDALSIRRFNAAGECFERGYN